jgi:SAM-dependent methyltransferase
MTTMQGHQWGARADDWATIQEWEVRPVYDRMLDELGPWRGVRLLDVGCGSGGFASLAAAQGATVAGIDASAELIAIAERRVPEGAFVVGEMTRLPYADDSFAVVTGLNSFQYSAHPARALREAARVVRPGGRVAAMVWGAPTECAATGYLAAVAKLLPRPDRESPGSFALSRPGALEAAFAAAGLTPSRRRVVVCPWYYPDEETALRGLLSACPAVSAIEHRGEERVRAAILEAIAPLRAPDGSYLLRNTFHYVMVTV